ncbi:hypothetical protein PR001_g1878 [Phytophthora rubi]|uniref:Uncharacterized protein n=1 Tax=Phytophthora rubi TaxID=129364 RepID=A0A6A3PEA0_9STRA|nr:hypothetical protein PR001_g1878 [Phytophthora rubi]
MALRAWSWTRIDGRNVLAVPTQTEIRLYDSDDFILLARLAPSGHRSPVAFVRWSAFHAKLASLSAELLLVHAPQRDAQSPDQDSGRGGVHFAAVCRLRLDAALGGGIRGLAFSRSADELLFCGRGAGLGKLSVKTGGDRDDDQALVLWKQEAEGCDMAKYSPSAFVFASLQKQEREVKVWRMQRRLGDSDENQKLDRVEVLQHPDPVVYFSWKPSTTQWHSALETDGTRKAQWFEPARILLTCTATRSVRIWTEKEAEHGEVCFQSVLVFEPTYPIDNVRWVMSKNRNISDENFQVVNDVHDKHADWISGVDHNGILRLWRVVGVVSNEPTVEETTLQIKVNGEDDSKKGVDMSVRLGEVCVMAYFSQNYFGMPSKLGIVLQRADHIMMSFHVAVGEGDRPSQILKKSWYRSHLGSISALSAHPSLPLIASVDTHPSQHDGTWRNEILVYWISFSAFSAESRLIPSGVLPCAKDSGEVLCIQWVPTLHFDATPILLVAFESGNIGHWRCQVVGTIIHFTMMSSHSICRSTSPPSPNGHQVREVSGSFCRRGYVSADQLSSSRQCGDADTVIACGISHIEVDDPNRLAVLHADHPEELHVFEAESGLGILRSEEFIPSNGRGHILGFCWCGSHVEFNVDALAVRYESVTVIYQYDTNLHRWAQVGDDIVSPLPLFDCTRDSSALLIGGGHLKDSRLDQPSFQPISNEMPVVIGKWDEPGSLLQHSMDWKAAESPQKLPVWHPYVLLTTMFGMHARVGEKDTSLAGDRASYEFSRAFKDATQMLKLLAKVMDDEPSARASATSGVLSYTGPERARRVSAKENGSGRARMLESIGRYSTAIHRSGNIDKAENLFAAPMNSQRTYNYDEDDLFAENDDQDTLTSTEAATILAAVDAMLLGRRHPLQANASVLFASFSEEHLLEMKALLSFVEAIQSLGFDLDASAADLGAKRFFSMFLFAKSLRSIVLAHSGSNGDLASNPQNGDSDPFSGKLKWRNSFSERDGCFWLPNLEETPSSGLLWALHSDAQQFLWEHCIQPTMQWDDIRPMWLGLWIKDAKDLRGIVERFAKVSYARTKDAMDVCLFYVALGKQKVLSVLAKLTQSESNKVLASFLENDFSDKRWSNAAIKNAYSLLSKKKYEAAAAFFLLCDPPHVQDAIRVLSVRLGDPSLALIISRLVEYRLDDKLQNDFTMNQAGITPAGDVTKQLLEQDVVPLFRLKREVWLESCALWWLEEFEQSWAVLLPQFQDVDFQVDRNYVYEAALAVMHPHAYLHIVEVCFLLSELNRVSTLRKWVEYVSLSMLHSCSTFASCSIAEDVYRDWEGLTIQLCYILNLDAQGQISIPPRVIAHISVAVRTGIIFLGWAGQRSDIVRQAVSLPFYTYGTTNVGPSGESSPSLSSFAFEKNLHLLCRLLQRPAANASETRKTRGFEGNLGYTFLGAVAARQTSDDNISLLSWGGIANAASQNQFKIRKMYTLILMVSVLRTLYARATVFLSTYQEGIDDDDDEVVEADISSSLFTPKKLWKALGEGPLEGLKRWYALIESHLRCEFDYSVKEVPCLCGLYGLDTAAFEEAAAANRDWKRQVSHECDGGTSDTSINSGGEDGNPIIDREDVIKPKDISTPTTMETSEDESPNSLKSFLREIGMSYELHTALVSASDDYVLLLMQNAKFGVRTTSRRFRVDPRVYVKSFVLRDAFSWFARHQIFSGDTKADTIAQIHAFLTRCCKQRKLRLLVAHRGEDTQMFPLDRCHPRPRHDSDVDANSAASVTSELPIPRSRLPSVVGSVTSEVPTSRSRLSSGAMGSEPSDYEPLPEALYLQSMMFVDPWEVEAEWNVRRYMHASQPPLHVELGWDRLSPICLETCDNIVDSAFEDPDLVAMWRTTGGEGWLVTAITQYRLDGLHSYRTLYQHIQRGLAGKEEPRIPLLVEIYSRSQRNAMFEEAGLPHRFIGAITVELVEAKDLIACSWIGKWSNAYVFLELSHAKDTPRETAEEWSLQTYRSPVGEGGVHPKWDTEENKFVFRFAIPTHGKHTGRPTTGVHFCNGEGGARRVDTETSRLASQLWNANVTDKNRAAVDALEKLLPSVFSGPPAMLRCTVYQKNKVLSHQFMGRAKVPLDELTSGNPMDSWLPLEDTSSGSLHVRISLSFQLMCSSMAGQEDSR